MAGQLPPPPVQADSNSFVWVSWYSKLHDYLTKGGQILWSSINKAGSSLTDIQDHSHEILTGLQGGTTGEHYHLTAAQVSAVNGTASFGAFSDYTTQTATSNVSANLIKFNTTDFTHGVVLTNTTRITAGVAGLYNLQFSVQLSNTDTAIRDVSIWLRKNGNDIVGSTGVIAVPSSHGGSAGHILSGWNYPVRLAATEYIELVWSTGSTLVTIATYPASTNPTKPSTASVVATLSFVRA